MNKGYYAIIPASVRYDKSLTPNAKLLYGEITALCNDKGYCWAGNDYFAALYDVSKTSVSKWISALRDCGYINIQLEYAEGTKQILHRYIRLIKDPIEEKLNTPLRKVKDPIEEKLIVNNTSNTTINNTMNKGRFTPPTLTEVIDQCNRTGANIDPQGFIDFYESKGWMIGKNKMKCWKSAIRTWTRKEREKQRERAAVTRKKQDKHDITKKLTDTSWAE